MNGIIQKYHVSKNDCNLASYTRTQTNGYYIDYNMTVIGEETYNALKAAINNYSGDRTFNFITNNEHFTPNLYVTYSDDTVSDFRTPPFTIRSGKTVKTLLIRARSGSADYNNIPVTVSKFMLNSGSTALPYEPHGNTWVDSSYRRYETATDVVTNLPVKVYGDGETDISLLLKGNTEISGTPSPQNPVTISGVGNETANLLPPPAAAASGEINGITYNVSADGVCTFSGIATSTVSITVDLSSSFVIPISVSSGGSGALALNNSKVVNAFVRFYNGNTLVDDWGLNSINRTSTGYVSIGGKTITKYVFQFTSGINADGLSVAVAFSDNGVPVSPFEPYGYKIPISSGSTTTPIYISQQLYKIGEYSDNVVSSGTATYNVAKYEFTGTERVQKNYSEDPTSYLYYTSMTIAADEVICTHLPYGAAIPKTDIGITGRANNNILYLNFGADIMNAQTSGNTANGLKEYLAAQYAAGTPVTVYYVLATPTTESVTAPEITTTGGEVSIDVDTTVKPSELDLTYHGWHEHQPLKRENGAWV